MMGRIISCIMLGFIMTVVVGCARLPKSFVQVMEPTWTSVAIRDNISHDEAWQQVVDVLAKKIELAMILKRGRL